MNMVKFTDLDGTTHWVAVYDIYRISENQQGTTLLVKNRFINCGGAYLVAVQESAHDLLKQMQTIGKE